MNTNFFDKTHQESTGLHAKKKVGSVLIIGAGISGATAANILANQNFDVTVYEERKVVAGNVATETLHGINVHKYGAHIFHTDNKVVWDFVNKFGEFNTYRHHVIAKNGDKIIPLPFSMFTFNAIWPEVQTPQQAIDKIAEETAPYKDAEPKNLEEQALKLVGPRIYDLLIKTYTEKQWGRQCSEIPASVIQRIPMRFTYDSNYFFDRYQGIPIDGYSKIVENMLDHVNITVETSNYINKPTLEMLKEVYDYVIFTGAIDEFMEYEYGTLEYRSLEFVNMWHTYNKNVTGHSVINITDASEKYTRTIEHRHFMQNCTSNKSIVTMEYPREWKAGDERYYPVGDAANKQMHKKYAEAFSSTFGNKALLLGRLAEYKYTDMDDSVENAMHAASKIIMSTIKL